MCGDEEEGSSVRQRYSRSPAAAEKLRYYVLFLGLFGSGVWVPENELIN